MLDHLPIGERGKMGDTQINTHIFIGDGQFFRGIDFTTEDNEPLIHFPLDRDRFDLPFERSMQFDLASTNLAESETVAVQFPSRAIRVGETIVAVTTFEPGKAWSFPILEAAEEVPKRSFDAQDHVLEDVGSNVLVLFPVLFDIHQVALLPIVADE